jgi:hypothetical protein
MQVAKVSCGGPQSSETRREILANFRPELLETIRASQPGLDETQPTIREPGPQSSAPTHLA